MNQRIRAVFRADVSPVVLAALALLLHTGAAADTDQTTLVHPPFGHCLGITRVTSFHLFLHLGGRTRFDEPAGITAVKLKSKDDPSTPHDDDELTVFGLNSGRSELIYNTSLYAADIYGSPGSGPGSFRNPLDVAADERGNVFVADTGNDRIVRLAYEDDTLRYVRSFGTRGPGEREFFAPEGVALGASGTVYVADTGNDRVVLMSGAGAHESAFTKDTSGVVLLDAPRGIDAVEADDPWIARRLEFIAVTDRGGGRLTTFGRDGRLLASVTVEELPVPGASLGDVAIDYYGNVYAVDRGLGAVHKFDAGLAYVTTFGSSGTGEGEFDEPRGITIWRRFGQIFVTERAGAQYYWIGTDIEDPALEPQPVVPGESSRIRYRLTEVSRVTAEILDDDGDIVHTLFSNRRRAVGVTAERFDGSFGMSGSFFAPGRYTFRLRARPTYSSGQYFEDVTELRFTVQERPEENAGGR